MRKSERIEERYRKNTDLLPVHNSYVYSQTAERYRDLLYGEKGSVGPNGCGAVAVHNAMKFTGRNQNFCDVLHDMEALNMPWIGGRFGTKPWALGRYFRRHNIPYRKYSSPVDFKAALLTNAVGIVCTWNRKFYGMHFYCVYYSKEENRYYTANYRSSTERFRPTSLDEISNTRFVVGYVINPDK